MHLRSSFRMSPFAPLALFLLGLSLLPAALFAEDVYLKNGRVFRGVIATVQDGAVRIEMPGGTLSFPITTVSHIEASDAVYREYQGKRDALERSSAKAADWLELARWAKAHGLEPAAREAALAAGRIDPATPGVRAFLGELGFVFDEASGGFLALEESMARRGLVYDGGVWIPSAEREARRERARTEAVAQLNGPTASASANGAGARADAVEPDDVVGIPLGVGGYGYGSRGVIWPGGFGPGAVRPQRPRRRPEANAPSMTPPQPAPQRPLPQPMSASARRGTKA